MKKLIYPVLSLLLLLWYSACSNGDDDRPEIPTAVDKTANLRGTGESAQDMLVNTDFTEILVEIAYVRGFRPTQEAMDSFVEYLKRHTFKENINFIYTELESPEEDSLTLDEIAELESDNRTAYNNGETLAVYIYFTDAPAEDDEEEEGLVTLGAVYRNTSMIVHEATVRRLAAQSIFISNADVEASTINHEFGHLFGLVNLGTAPVNDHEDIQRDAEGEPVLNDSGNTQGNSHCNVEGCLMSAELQFGGPSNKIGSDPTAKNLSGLTAGCRLSGKSLLKMLASNAAKGNSLAPNLDSECILDLQSVGGR